MEEIKIDPSVPKELQIDGAKVENLRRESANVRHHLKHISYLLEGIRLCTLSIILLFFALIASETISIRWLAILALSCLIYYVLKQLNNISPFEGGLLAIFFWMVVSIIDTRDVSYNTIGIRWSYIDPHRVEVLVTDYILGFFGVLVPVLICNLNVKINGRNKRDDSLLFMMVCASFHIPTDASLMSGYTPILITRCIFAPVVFITTVYKHRAFTADGTFRFKNTKRAGVQTAIDMLSVFLSPTYMMPCLIVLHITFYAIWIFGALRQIKSIPISRTKSQECLPVVNKIHP